jgi:hypothetical protein
MSIRIAHALHLNDRSAGDRMLRTLRVRRSCASGSCRYRYAIQDKYGTFTRHPLQALSPGRFRERETFHRPCTVSGRFTSRGRLDLRAASTVVRGGRQLLSRVDSTFRVRSTGSAAGGYEAWTFTAARVDLPAPPQPAHAPFSSEPEEPSVAANANTVFFTDASDGDEVTGWSWDFGDPASGAADTGTETDPQHAYATPGVFLCRRVGWCQSGSRSPKWILKASNAVVQLRFLVHAGTAL